jgi:thiamine-phosphate pyrophosphorylase
MVIVLTPPYDLPAEARLLIALLDAGLNRLHLRKPHSSTADLAALLTEIPEHHHRRIVVHGHPELCGHFSLAGVHGATFPGAISCSLHALEELPRARDFEYVFLSPIFPSSSKPGYLPRFSLQQCQESLQSCPGTVMALGGVTPETAPRARQAGFSGVAAIGAVWGFPPALERLRELRAAWETPLDAEVASS